MSDAEFRARIGRITDPCQLLREVVEHFRPVSTGPYTNILLDRCEELASPAGWNDIRSIPVGEFVTVRSVSGMECLARVRGGFRVKEADRFGPARVACVRPSKEGNGDIAAVAWKSAGV